MQCYALRFFIIEYGNSELGAFTLAVMLVTPFNRVEKGEVQAVVGAAVVVLTALLNQQNTSQVVRVSLAIKRKMLLVVLQS